ncbi:diguanylate cyclase/phosphodiesterase (GGDEF & EAL domains) with PAS/PAC sensor(s) [Leptospirillum ferriphilum]|jgi:diguanylate cyclase (GGDEF)-like protein/PAS domain S-box-containing protein|uniref:Diguanylate cyclase/phosphodiesterase (GGDEF & EAL domains) with PAS/PAC sensor(S) n=2 Tax=Leptospirillum TaxID=179 RepID=A0A094WFH1_9BACT|nr:EAL domain-containing protein [Leptospirillum ferriphilum]EDZ38511.1 MAG: Diguanylate cyclase/phosphodiesterase with PAS/PAC and GAF sensor(s) [Leptospirillum sp. Group II '5-way CG']KGA94392.1 diguanylate cyclase/phosphodiesterase (GGDEF & EAL domains) with PAS/PAC sensor(s) [Leptospirillum ferriphilum]
MPEKSSDGERVDERFREEMESILMFQQEILEAVVRGDPEKELVERVCTLEEQLVPGAVASVMLFDRKNQLLNIYVAPSLPKEAFSKLENLRPGPENGSCANAVYSRMPVYVGNVLTDPRWKNLRSFATDYNLNACWSIPIRSEGNEIIGTFALSSYSSRQPNRFQERVLGIGAHIIGIVLDRSRREGLLRLSENILRKIREAILVTDDERKILFVNEAFSSLTGFSETELAGNRVDTDTLPFFRTPFGEGIWKHLDTHGFWEGDVPNKKKNGESYLEWLRLSAMQNDRQKTTHYLAISSDITTRKANQDRLDFLAHHDPLTELPNRVLLRERFEQILESVRSKGTSLAILVMDLDNFHLVNSSLGHAAGDLLLVEISRRLAQLVGPSNMVGRVGGDMFLALVEGERGGKSVVEVVERISDSFRTPLEVDRCELFTSVSIGVAFYPEHGQTYEDVVRSADRAMACAKSEGKNTYRFFLPSMTVDVSDHLRIHNSFRQGLERNEFILHYQPQVGVFSRKVEAVEALVRWNHPEMGFLYPKRFVPVAETTGMIIPLGEWVLQEACLQASRWNAQGFRVPVSVNISGIQLRRRNFEATVLDALARSGLPPELLELELTETMLLEDSEGLLRSIARLKEIGVRLSIDDFGTGYSNLAYLKRFDADKIKIDQTFVHAGSQNPEQQGIVRMIAGISHVLGLSAVAEGVETGDQMEYLVEIGIDSIQGNFLSKPLDPVSCEEYLLRYCERSGRDL